MLTIERYKVIIKRPDQLPRLGDRLFRSHKQAMRAVRAAMKSGLHACLSTYEKTDTGLVLTETKYF